MISPLAPQHQRTGCGYINYSHRCWQIMELLNSTLLAIPRRSKLKGGIQWICTMGPMIGQLSRKCRSKSKPDCDSTSIGGINSERLAHDHIIALEKETMKRWTVQGRSKTRRKNKVKLNTSTWALRTATVEKAWQGKTSEMAWPLPKFVATLMWKLTRKLFFDWRLVNASKLSLNIHWIRC
jgi:hypothetical protein